jgi:outer membrane cobalamin receptor
VPTSSRLAPCAALLALLAAPAAARDPAPTPGPRSGPAYDVFVSEDEALVEQIGPRRVVDQERIRERSARTLDEVLRLEPGIYVRSGNEGVPRVDMRGLRSRQVLLLLDGIPYNSTEDGQFDPALIPTESIERVKLGFGSSSVLYGDGPMAGVIQIETKRPEDGLHGSLGGDFRSGEQLLGRFALTGRRGAFDGLAAGSVFDRDTFPLADGFDPSPSQGDGDRENADRERRNLLLRGGWTPSETTRFGALVSLVDGEHGVPPNAIDDDGDPFASRVRYERVEDQRGISGQLSMQWDPDGPLDVRSWLYANQLGEDRRRYDDDSYDSIAANGSYRADNDSLLMGHALHAGWSLGEYGTLKGAFQSRREDFDTEGTMRVRRALADFDDTFHQSVYNGGLEYEVEPLRDVGLVLGYGHSFLDKDSGENDDGTTFLAGSFWKPRPGMRLRGSLSRKVRFPSLRQLYEPGSGNADLGAEHSWNYELGVSQELPGRTLVDVTAFWLDVDDFIESDEATGEFRNQDRYRFRGVELTVRTQPFESLDLLASYSFLDSENRSSGSDQNGLQNRPEHRATFEARYRLPYGFAVRGALYYVADQVVYSRQEPVRQRGTGDYFLAELRLAKTLLEERAWLYFGVDNLADANYQESYGVPGPGRVFYGGLEGRF